MPTKPPDFDSISSAIGELRAESRQHAENSANVIIELRRLGERLDAITRLGAELREYRKTLHDRFDRINEILSQNILAIDKLEERLISLENDKMISLERRIAVMETVWKQNWRTVAIVGSVLLTVMGWTIGSYGHAILKIFFGPPL